MDSLEKVVSEIAAACVDRGDGLSLRVSNYKLSVRMHKFLSNAAIWEAALKHLLQKDGSRVSVISGELLRSTLYVKLDGKYSAYIYKGGHLNVTGVPDVGECVDTLCSLLDWPLKSIIREYTTVDNTTISGKLPTLSLPLHMDLLYQEAANVPAVEVRLNFEAFPSLKVKTDSGTLLVFATGSIVLVGCKSGKDVAQLREIALHLLRKCERRVEAATAAAAAAAAASTAADTTA